MESAFSVKMIFLCKELAVEVAIGPFPHMLLTSCNVELTTSSSFISLCIETQALIWDLNDDMIENGRRICDGSNNKLKLSIRVCVIQTWKKPMKRLSGAYSLV